MAVDLFWASEAKRYSIITLIINTQHIEIAINISKSTVLYEGRYFAWVVTYSLKNSSLSAKFCKTYQELTSDDCHWEKCWQLRLGVEVDRIKHKCKNFSWYIIISVTEVLLVNQYIFMHLYFACFFYQKPW